MAETREWTYPGVHGSIVGRTWQGSEEPRRVVVIAHGYGEHVGRYERLADALVRDDAAVYAVDHVGHGKSEGERVLISDFEDVVTDLHRLAETARDSHPGLPVVLLGHSMGGLIAARYLQRYGESLTALVLSSPVLGRWEVVPRLLALEEIPDDPLDVSTLSRDPAVGEAYAADPLVWHGPFKRPTLEALERTLSAVNAGPGMGALPTLWIHGEADQLVPLDGTREGIERLRSPALREQIYPGARHELFNETNRDEVTRAVLAFIAEHAP